MTIIVEDGTNVADANSYVSVADLVAYAEERGIELPVDPAEQEVLLIKAMDYLESFETRFPGVRAYTGQMLAWPRYGAGYNYFPAMPDRLRKAQLVAAVAAMEVDLLPVSAAATANATRKTVGPITVEYSSQASRHPSIPELSAIMNELFGTPNGQLKVVRG